MNLPERVRRLFRLDRGVAGVDDAVDDELDFHFEQACRELEAAGHEPAAARAEALRRFGDLERVRRELRRTDRYQARESRRGERWSGLAQDVRYAVRGFRLRPGFTLGVVLTLALGIGANATMFGIVDQLLLRTPPDLMAPSRVNRIFFRRTVDGKEFAQSANAYPRYTDVRRLTSTFVTMAGYWSPRLVIGDEAQEERVTGATASFWSLFRIRPALGRLFTEAEDEPPTGVKVAVLSFDYWQRAMGGDPGVLGRTIRIGSGRYAVVGVMPRGFTGLTPTAPAAFIPLSALADEVYGLGPPGRRWNVNYGNNWLVMVGERKPGVSVAQADADLSHAFALSYATQLTTRSGWDPIAIARPRGSAEPIQVERGPNRSSSGRVATWLVGVALIVLLIACANVANLLLTQALRRRREIAVRLALGITRTRLIAQLLLESLLLAGAGACLGLMLAQWGGGVLRRSLLQDVSWTTTVTDRRVVLFTVLVALAVGVLTGLAPVSQARRMAVVEDLKGGDRAGTRATSFGRIGLLLVQGTLSLVLLVGAGLFVRSLHKVRSMPLGYEPSRVLYAEVHPRGVPLDSAAWHRLNLALEARGITLPGVVSASHTVSVPFYTDWEDELFIPGRDSVNNLGQFVMRSVSPDYFRTMGTRILRGRGITDADRAGGPLVVVVSESMARLLWPGQEAIGQCLKHNDADAPCSTVIGIAEDIVRGSLTDDARLQYYLSNEQFPVAQGGTYFRVQGDAALQVEPLRSALQGVVPGDAYVTVRPLTDFVDPMMRSWALGATMFTVFGGLALLVAAVGLYSVITFSVAQRRREMGVRVALGARPGRVIRLVVTQGMRVMLAAFALGIALSLLAARWISPLLFRVSPRDPLVLGGVVLLLLPVSLAACLIPARRAAGVDPVEVLRGD
jgi:predicted permease